MLFVKIPCGLGHPFVLLRHTCTDNNAMSRQRGFSSSTVRASHYSSQRDRVFPASSFFTRQNVWTWRTRPAYSLVQYRKC